MSLMDLVAKLTLDTSQYEQGLDGARTTASTVGSKIGSALGIAAKTVGLGIAATSTAMLNFGKSSVAVGEDFDKAMSQVAATMGTTVDGLESEIGTAETSFGTFTGNLRDFAKFMGQNTAFSATQAAEALNYMALAGYDAQESMDMLPNVLSLAAAGNFDLARASDMVTDAQTAFGISSDRTTQMVDEMAKAASTGNTSVEQLGDAFLVVGGLAAELNGGMVTLANGTETSVDGIQELEIALTAMANAGVKGSEAGTHMRNMLLKLSSPTDDGTKALEEMGVAVFDADGKMRSLSSIFGDLNKQLSVMKQSDKIKVISTLFNTRDLASAEALLNAVSEDWDDIGSAILEAQGSAALMAETQLDNLAGDVTLFKSALEGAQIVISDQLTPTLRKFVQFGTEGIGKISTAFEQNGLSGAAEALGTFLSDGIAMISEKIPDFIDAGASLFMSLAQGMIDNIPQLVTAIVTAFANLVTTIGQKAPELITSFVGAVLSAIEALTQPDMISSLIQAAITLVNGLVAGINKAIPEIIKAVPTIITNLVTALTDPNNIQAMIQGGVDLLMSLVEAIPQIAIALFEATPQIIEAIVKGIFSGAEAIAGAFFDLIFGGFTSGVTEAQEAVSANVESMQAFIKSLTDVQPTLMDVNGLLSDQGNSVWDLNHAIDEAENGITTILSTAMAEQRALREEDIEAIRKYRDEINALEQEKLQIYQSQQQAVYSSIKRNAENMTQQQAAAMIKNAEKARDETVAAAEEMYYNELAIIENRKNAGEFLTEQQYEAEIAAAERTYSERQANASRFYSASLAELQKYSADWLGEETKKWNAIKQGNEEWQSSVGGSAVEFFNSLGIDTKRFTGDMQKTYAELFKKMDTDSAAGFITWLGTFKEGGLKIEGANKETAEAILSTFEDLPDDLDGLGKDTLLGLVGGIKDQIPALKDTSEMSAEEVVAAVKDYLGIASPSKVMQELGGFTIDGLIEGIESKKAGIESAATSIASAMKTAVDGKTNDYYNIGYNMAEGMRQGFLNQEYRLTSSVSGMISRVNYAARAKLDIHSPSKVWMKMGEQTGEGFEIGLQDSMGDAILGMRDIFDDMESFSPVMNAPEVQPQANTGRNYVEQVVININAADFDSIDDLADAVSQRMWEATEQKERSYA